MPHLEPLLLPLVLEICNAKGWILPHVSTQALGQVGDPGRGALQGQEGRQRGEASAALRRTGRAQRDRIEQSKTGQAGEKIHMSPGTAGQLSQAQTLTSSSSVLSTASTVDMTSSLARLSCAACRKAREQWGALSAADEGDESGKGSSGAAAANQRVLLFPPACISLEPHGRLLRTTYRCKELEGPDPDLSAEGQAPVPVHREPPTRGRGPGSINRRVRRGQNERYYGRVGNRARAKARRQDPKKKGGVLPMPRLKLPD